MSSGRCVRRATGISLLLFGTLSGGGSSRVAAQQWKQHDPARPHPPAVQPAPAGPAVLPPADAIVLFDGHGLGAWQSAKDGPAAWKLAGDYMEVSPGQGAIHTRDGFGDVQLHVEWATPPTTEGSDQEPGNSGVFLMGMYEVQVLDSWHNVTYADGQAGAIYGEFPPMVNASRPPGQWQTYDIVFTRPRFAADGAVQSPAYLTVLHNGVLIHDHVALVGPTANQARPPYKAHPDRLPLQLQDHGQPVRYREIWIRDLEKH